VHCSKLAPLALIVALLAATPSARADVPPPSSTAFQLEQFEPSPLMGTDILNVSTSDVMPHLTPSVGVLFHYVNNPLVLRNTEGGRDIVERLVEHQLKAEVAAAIGLFDIFALGFVLPVTMYQAGGDLGVLGRPNEAIGGAALQDARLFVKARLLDPEDFGGFGLHVTVPIYLPTGDVTAFGGDDVVRVRPTLGLEYRREGSFLLALNVGYMFRPERPAHDYTSDHAIPFALGFEINTPHEPLSVIGSVFGAVTMGASRDPIGLEQGLDLPGDRGFDVPLEVIGGVRYRFDDDWSAQAGVGTGLTGDVGAPVFRGFAGVAYTPTTRDRDGDGIPDRDDACPDDPEDLDGFEDADGCPDPDNDGDGICDPWVSERGELEKYREVCRGVDQCPDDPEDFDGFEDEDGCPDADNDGDGICDPWVAEKGQLEKYKGLCKGVDQCPDDPEDFDGFEDEDGCPDPDNDGDGVCDPWVSEKGLLDKYADVCKGVDQCPDDPEDLDGFEDEDGCPDADNDGDGICDPWVAEKGQLEKYKELCKGIDKCPDQPETFNDFEDDDGCPDTKSKDIQITEDQIVILQKVFFAYNRDVIKAESYDILNEVATVLTENPWITGIRVEGHTDSDGGRDYNKDLSTRRAASVVRYLIEKGVAPERLTSQGFGLEKPLVPNTTRANKATNRRVEFTITSVRGKSREKTPDVIIEDNRATTEE